MKQYSELEFAKYLAKEAGKIMISYFGKASISEKGVNCDIVTEADMAVDERLRALIKDSNYDYPILSEENDAKVRLGSEHLWIIDPIDGTVNYSKKSSRFSCSIALAHGGSVCTGVVYAPILSELFHAERGNGAYLNDECIHVSDTCELRDAVICIDGGYRSTKDRERRINLYSVLSPPVIMGIRQTASAALDLCDVANGRFDAYV